MAERKIPEINAGSMADIAFLLLIFFLVTTTIQTDTGLNVLLPPYVEEPPPPEKKNERNVFAVQINGNDGLLVRGKEEKNVKNIKDRLKKFIMNYGKDPGSSKSPKLAVVSLLNDNGTSVKMYVAVYDQLKAAYNELWDESSMSQYGRHYDDLTKDERKGIRADIPLVISEAEPSNYDK